LLRALLSSGANKIVKLLLRVKRYLNSKAVRWQQLEEENRILREPQCRDLIKKRRGLILSRKDHLHKVVCKVRKEEVLGVSL
jgi:hypothetical protein